MTELSKVRELSHDTLVRLVADVWEIDGWSTISVDPNEKLELNFGDQSLKITVPSDPPVNIIAIQTLPCIRVEYIYIKQGGPDKIIGPRDLAGIGAATSAQHTPTATIVTTGAVEESIWNTRAGRGLQIVDGATLCKVIEIYADQGLDYDEYFEQ